MIPVNNSRELLMRTHSPVGQAPPMTPYSSAKLSSSQWTASARKTNQFSRIKFVSSAATLFDIRWLAFLYAASTLYIVQNVERMRFEKNNRQICV